MAKTESARFEQAVCDALCANGFWAMRIVPNPSGGQPFDVIAARDGKAHAIECKVCQSGKFQLSRVEDNQIEGMKAFQAAGNMSTWFAFKRADGSVWFQDAMDVIWYAKQARGDNGEADLPIFRRIDAGTIAFSQWVNGVAKMGLAAYNVYGVGI